MDVVWCVALVEEVSDHLDGATTSGIDGSTLVRGDVVEKLAVRAREVSILGINRPSLLNWKVNVGVVNKCVHVMEWDKFLTNSASQPLKTMSTIVIEPPST